MIEQHPPRETLQVTENIGAECIWFWRLACFFSSQDIFVSLP